MIFKFNLKVFNKLMYLNYFLRRLKLQILSGHKMKMTFYIIYVADNLIIRPNIYLFFSLK
jgi:hypothetical protein